MLKEKFPGIYELGNSILTKNLAPGKKVYGEEVKVIDGKEYRVWNPFRSKLGAAIKNGLKEFPIKPGNAVLYLGSAEGTTVSHISDIVGEKGIVFGVDISARVMNKFIFICEQRPNIVPILADANEPNSYKKDIGGFSVDVLFQDVSQKNQAEIFLKNSRVYLRGGKHGLLTIKAHSISSEKSLKEVLGNEEKKLYNEFNVQQVIDLSPFEKEHAVIYCKRKN